MSGGSGTTPTIPTYYVGVHFVLGHGPFDSISEIRVDDRVAWSGSNTGGLTVVDAPELFGGNSREGGVTGVVEVAMGLPAQTPSTYLASKLGTIPAYRGVVSAILQHVCTGTNYYLKPWSFLATRIHKRKNGVVQWQDSYAALSSTTLPNQLPGTLVTLGHTGVYSNVVMDTPHNMLPGQIVTVTGATGADASKYNGTFVIQTLGWTDTTFSYIMTGTPGANATGAPVIQAGFPATSASGSLINAVHVIRECLTDSTWGLGISDSLIHEASFLAAAQTCYNEGLGFGFLWNKDGSIKDFIDEVSKHIQANLYLDRQDGLYHLSLVRYITDTSGLITLNSTNTREVTDFKRSSVGNLTSEVTIKFVDNATHKDNSVTIIDAGLAQRQGYSVPKIIEYSGIASVDVAHKIAIRDLLQLSTPVYSCSISCDRTAENLNIGDAFILDWPDYIDTPLVMRVLSMSLGTANKQGITIEAIQDVFHAANTVYYTPPSSGWVDPVTYPIPVELRILNEAPYYLVATREGDSFAQGVPTTTGYIAIAGSSPTGDSMVANLWTTTGSTFVKRKEIDFCFSGLLASGIDKVATSVTITSEIDLVLLTIGHFVQIGNELLGVTNIVGSVLTVTRGVLDTVPESHATNDRVYGWHDFYASDEIEYLTGEIVKTKLTTVTPKGELDIAAALQTDVTIVGRMHKPYPPGDFKINGSYWPASVTLADLVLTWTSRNRFQQTTSTLTDYYSASITSEPSVTYSGELRRVDTNAILLNFSGETGLTRTFDTYTTLPGSVTSITRVGTLASVTMSTAHGRTTGDKVVISGASDSLYNGTFVITVTGGSTFDYTMTGTPAASPATGTLVANSSIYTGNVKVNLWSVNPNGASFQVVSHTFSLT